MPKTQTKFKLHQDDPYRDRRSETFRGRERTRYAKRSSRLSKLALVAYETHRREAESWE